MAKNSLTKYAVNGLFQYKRRKAQNKNSLKVMKSLMVHLLNVFFWYQRRLRHYKMNYIYPFLLTECNLDIQINYIESILRRTQIFSRLDKLHLFLSKFKVYHNRFSEFKNVNTEDVFQNIRTPPAILSRKNIEIHL